MVQSLLIGLSKVINPKTYEYPNSGCYTIICVLFCVSPVSPLYIPGVDFVCPRCLHCTSPLSTSYVPGVSIVHPRCRLRMSPVSPLYIPVVDFVCPRCLLRMSPVSTLYICGVVHCRLTWLCGRQCSLSTSTSSLPI